MTKMRDTLRKMWETQKKILVVAFLLIFTATLFLYAGFQQNNIRNVRLLMADSEKIVVDEQTNKIDEEINSIGNDLDFLYESPSFKKYINGKITKDALEEEWVVFVNTMKKYDKLRYINFNGDEIVRINFNDGHAERVDENFLENKSSRYYVIEALAHNDGEKYITKLDLNTGEDIFGLPNKPLIRAAVPVFDAKKEKRGIIILDYSGEAAFSGIKKTNTNIRHMQFVNSNGDSLTGVREEKGLAYINEEKNNKSFKKDFPAEWARIKATKNGQFFSNKGIFTFRFLNFTNTMNASITHDNLGNTSGFIISQISASGEPFANDINGYLLSLLSVFYTPLLFLSMILFSIVCTILFAMYEENRAATKMMLIYDKLTGCINRAFGMRIIETEIKRAERYSRHLALILLDIDHFKKVNDTFGHMVGDIVLKSIADITKRNVRKSDSIIRIGGEEFLILLPETDVVAAAKVAENIRIVMENHVHPLVGHVTVSCGVSERMPHEKFSYWYLRLDEALYKAKRGGRNKVVVTEDKVSETFDASNLAWKNEWESGNKEIDDQHKNILKLGDKLIAMSISDADNKEIVRYFDLLLEDISIHFNYEEKILADLGYPQYEEHSNIHKELVVKAKYLRDQYLSGEIKPTDLFSFIVSDIILGHMLSEDVKFFPLLKNKNSE